MKTRNLIISIIAGWLFWAIVAFVIATNPLWLPPVFSKQKKEAAQKWLQKFEHDFVMTYKPWNEKNVPNPNILIEKIINLKKDPWGNPYWYEIRKSDKKGNIYIILYSSGPDEKPNTKDDIKKRIRY